MDYRALLDALHAKAPLTEYARVTENGREYALVRIDVEGPRTLLITTGFHGEEPAGPLTLGERVADVIAHARAKNVGLRIYPCINPSGFEAGTRYNASGEKPNNDFLRYEVAAGDWRGELHGEAPLRWQLYDGGPKETRALRADLAAMPTPDGALDIHQDNWMQEQAAYAYVFGDDGWYVPLAKATGRHVRVVANAAVDEHNKTDANGLIRYHDGSVTDWFHRRGARFTAALETTTRTPLVTCQAVNLIWIDGFIELIASGGTRTTS